jgi:hypothetical protein
VYFSRAVTSEGVEVAPGVPVDCIEAVVGGGGVVVVVVVVVALAAGGAVWEFAAGVRAPVRKTMAAKKARDSLVLHKNVARLVLVILNLACVVRVAARPNQKNGSRSDAKNAGLTAGEIRSPVRFVRRS